MSNPVLCPHCSKPLYQTTPIDGGPHTTTIGKPPKIHNEGNKGFIFCNNNKCKKKVYMIKAGDGYRPSPIQ